MTILYYSDYYNVLTTKMLGISLTLFIGLILMNTHVHAIGPYYCRCECDGRVGVTRLVDGQDCSACSVDFCLGQAACNQTTVHPAALGGQSFDPQSSVFVAYAVTVKKTVCFRMIPDHLSF